MTDAHAASNQQGRLSERLRQLRAFLGGYFWKPCPRCGRMFGGYEEGGTLWTEVGGGKMLCKNCPDDYFAPGVPRWRTSFREPADEAEQ